MLSLYHQQLERLINTRGSLQEKQLVQHWEDDINMLLEPSQQLLFNGMVGLQIGIEDALSLKINLTFKKRGAIPSLLKLMKISPSMEAWGRYTLHHNLRFHCGIKLTPERLTHELYTFPSNFNDLYNMLGKNIFEEAVKIIKPIGGIGIDSHRGYSMYFNTLDTDWIDLLLNELGLENWQSRIWALQQTRFDGEKLIPGKTGMDLTPLSLEVLTRFISHYPFPYFRCLVPIRQYRGGTFGRDPVSGRFALYVHVV